MLVFKFKDRKVGDKAGIKKGKSSQIKNKNNEALLLNILLLLLILQLIIVLIKRRLTLCLRNSIEMVGLQSSMCSQNSRGS